MHTRNHAPRRPTAVARVLRADEERARETREYLLVVGAFLSGIMLAAGLLG